METFNVRVYWPQQPTAASHWSFGSREELAAWLPGVLAGPAYRITIEREPICSQLDRQQRQRFTLAGQPWPCP